MTIADAIKQLDRIRKRHGDEVQVFFDCPDCKRSFTPDLAAAEVHPVLRVRAAAKEDA